MVHELAHLTGQEPSPRLLGPGRPSPPRCPGPPPLALRNQPLPALLGLPRSLPPVIKFPFGPVLSIVGVMTSPAYLPERPSREDYVALLEGHLDTTEEETTVSDGRTLLKTYMLETVRNEYRHRSIHESFPEEISLEVLDESLFRVRDNIKHGGRVVGLLEMLDDRYPVFYTTMQSIYSDRWIRQNVDKAPWLDRIWLSSQILSDIWEHVRTVHHPNRSIRLSFEHEAKYEPSNELFALDIDNEFYDKEDTASPIIDERIKSKLHLNEKIGVLNDVLPKLIKSYDPLNSLIQLQIPARGKGGHLLNYDGKVTNRSSSFIEHRASISGIIKSYGRVTSRAEERLWLKTSPVGDSGFRFDGAPVLIQFDEKLSEETFERLISRGLQYRNSKLRIGGYIHRRGKTKIHMSAIDRHLWQPFIMEVTANHILALLPEGTCGNSIHRLVTNVQRYIAPKIRVWLGEQPYEEAVRLARKEL